MIENQPTVEEKDQVKGKMISDLKKNLTSKEVKIRPFNTEKGRIIITATINGIRYADNKKNEYSPFDELCESEIYMLNARVLSS